MNTSKRPKESNESTSKASLRMHPLNTMVLLLMFCYPRLLIMSVMPSKNNEVFAFVKHLLQNKSAKYFKAKYKYLALVHSSYVVQRPHPPSIYPVYPFFFHSTTLFEHFMVEKNTWHIHVLYYKKLGC